MLLNELFVEFFLIFFVTFERGVEKATTFLTFIGEVMIILCLLNNNFKNV